MSSELSSAATPPRNLRLGRQSSLWLAMTTIVTFLAASSAPSPLYGIYREAWGFSALVLTLIFASYAFALLAALLVFGALSDHVGRRAVIVAALALELGAMMLFLNADSVGWLVGARVLQGAATGMATSALSASLLDLSPMRGALFNSMAPLVGMAIGALGAAGLVQFGSEPTVRIYEVLLVIFGLQLAGALFLPELAKRRPGAWRSLVPSASVPRHARGALLRVLPLNTAGWALGGFYLSLGPTLARQVTGSSLPLVGGGLIATLVTAGAVTIFFVRHRESRQVMQGSALALVAGLALTLTGVHLHSSAIFFGGTLLAGIGFGAGFNACVRSLVPAVLPHERAGLMSSFFVLGYLAFSVPAIGAGLLAGRVGLETATLAYGSLLVLMCLASYGMTRAEALNASRP